MRVRGRVPPLPDELSPPVPTVAAAADRESWLAAGDGWTIRVVRWHGGGAEVSVTAVADDVAHTVLALATKDAATEQHADDGLVSMGFWRRSPRQGAYRAGRRMSAAPWPDIRANYPSAAAAALDALMAVMPDTVHGHLVLLHGAPGTGEDHRAAHPGVVRAGRCLAHIEIGPLGPAEAGAWLGRPVAGPVTLAELYAMRDGHAPARPPETGTGQYL